MPLRLPVPAALALLLTLSVAGCLSQPLDQAALSLSLAEPWRENWTTTGTWFDFEVDPAAKVLRGEGTMALRNDLGHPMPYVLLYLEPFDLAYVRDGQGRELEFRLDQEGGPATMLPEDLHLPASAIRVVNVTLQGDVGPGATHTLAMAYEGWGGRDQVLAGGGLPNDLAAARLVLQPRTNVVSNTGQNQAPSNFTLRHPADWVVLATAEPVEVREDGSDLVWSYTSHVGQATVYIAQGLEWIEEDVGGIQVRTYFFPDMRVQGRTTHDITRHVLTQMPALTGPYPFQHLWTVPHQVVLNAFSTPGMTFMGLNFYRLTIPGAPLQFSRAVFPASVPGGQDSYEQVVVHEHVHNWWGHNLRGNNTDRDLGPLETWVTEGVTTYLSELVWMETQYGSEDAAATARDRGLDVLRRRMDAGDERAITEPGGAPYSKTGMALRALQAYAIQQGKPDAVLDGLRLAQERHGRLQGGSGLADSEQMFLALEAAFGEPLRWHLDPWFFGRELSDFRVAGAQRGDGNLTVQVQNAGTVPAAVHLQATSLSGRVLEGWGFVPGGETVPVAVPLPAGFAEPVVRVEADPLQYVYEWDDTDNAWVGLA